MQWIRPWHISAWELWENPPLRVYSIQVGWSELLKHHFYKPFSFILFLYSAGPRNCLGTKYAYMLMKTIMVHLLNHFRFTTDLKYDDLKFRVNITLKLVQKHMLRVHPRQ